MELNYKRIGYNLSPETREELLKLAYEDDAFMDNSYKISFFKFPSRLQKFNTTGLKCVCQLLRVSESGSTIHKDKNRFNEFENIYMPRRTVINWPLTPTKSKTIFYDDDKQKISEVDYNLDLSSGAILNTGGVFHNVEYLDDGERITFQLCFEETIDEVIAMYEDIEDIVI